MIRRPPRSTQSRSSAASDVYKRHHVDPAPVLREPGVELGAHKRARQMGDGQRAVQRVVVADRDEVHAAAAGGRVHVERLGVRLPPTHRADAGVGGVVRTPRVDVKVSPVGHACLSHSLTLSHSGAVSYTHLTLPTIYSV